LIGSDCPFLSERIVKEMIGRMTEGRANAIMIPAEDGGYVSLATLGHYPDLFKNISWGTSRVAEQTIEQAKKIGISLERLDPLPDIDRPEDLDLLSNLGFHLDG
jgi:glycosyltransferase A (GT-A) superfamily protein (DUF2064 family)